MLPTVAVPRHPPIEIKVLPTRCNLSKTRPLALLGVSAKNAVNPGYQALEGIKCQIVLLA